MALKTAASAGDPLLRVAYVIVWLYIVRGCSLTAQDTGAGSKDVSPHKIQFVSVDTDVKLEVLDWGGHGRALIFLAGSGFDAHVFDSFATRFISTNHVYGISRKGSGASSAPAPTANNYSADHLADDVVAVIDNLKLERPVLVGHSLAGQELSSIGSRYPSKVAGLIYLDAGYSYAFYDGSLGDPIIDAADLYKGLDTFFTKGLADPAQTAILQHESARFASDLAALQVQRALMPPQPARPSNAAPLPAIPLALSKGRQKYTHIDPPVLAIYADPHNFGSLYQKEPEARLAVEQNDQQTTTAQANAFKKGVPSAQVILIPHADHFIFRSNEAEVSEAMKNFLLHLR